MNEQYDQQGYSFNEIQIAVTLLIPYTTLIIWIPVGSKLFYKFINHETRYYLSLIATFSILFVASTFISTLLVNNDKLAHSEYYAWICLIIFRSIMTILLSTILAMIDYKLHQLLLTYSVIVLQIDHVDYFSMSISLLILVLLLFAMDHINKDQYLISITYSVVCGILLLFAIIPYAISEIILNARLSPPKQTTKSVQQLTAIDSNESRKHKLLTNTHVKRKKKWKTKINAMQNYVYIRSLLSHYVRTPNTTPSLTLALQHVKLRKRKHNKGKNRNKLEQNGISDYVYITQTAADKNTMIQNGNHNDDFALIFSSTSHTNYTNIEYMDANICTPSRSRNGIRKGTFSQTFDAGTPYNYTPNTPYREYRNNAGHKKDDDDENSDYDDNIFMNEEDEELMIEKQKDKEQSFKLAQQIMNIAGKECEEMKINIDTLKTIQMDGLEIGINQPEKYIDDIDCIIAAILSLYNKYFRYYSINDRFLMEGRLHFDGCLRNKIKKGEPISLIYIGFPFKYFKFDDDNNDNNVYQSGIDMTDIFILNRLNEFCEKINEIYCYKSNCTIISMAPFLMNVIYDKNYNKKALNKDDDNLIIEKIKFGKLIMNYCFGLEKLINDGNKDGDDLFEYLEWLDILKVNAQSKFGGNMYNTDTDTDISDVDCGRDDEHKMYHDDLKILNKYKQFIETFSLQNKFFSSTISNALKSNNNLKQIYLKLNDWINIIPKFMLIDDNDVDDNHIANIEILNEKTMNLLKSYLRVLSYIESQLQHSIIFSCFPMNNECSSIIFSSFQSCRLGFTLSFFNINNEQYNLDKLNYFNCYGSNEIIFIISIDDMISFIPLNVISNCTDFEWKKIKNDNENEYIVFSLDGSLKFKLIKISNINADSKICNRIIKTWKLKQCVFDLNEYYCLKEQHTK